MWKYLNIFFLYKKPIVLMDWIGRYAMLLYFIIHMVIRKHHPFALALPSSVQFPKIKKKHTHTNMENHLITPHAPLHINTTPRSNPHKHKSFLPFNTHTHAHTNSLLQQQKITINKLIWLEHEHLFTCIEWKAHHRWIESHIPSFCIWKNVAALIHLLESIASQKSPICFISLSIRFYEIYLIRIAAAFSMFFYSLSHFPCIKSLQWF